MMGGQEGTQATKVAILNASFIAEKRLKAPGQYYSRARGGS